MNFWYFLSRFLGSPIKSLRSKSVFVKANGQSFASSTSTLTKLKKQVSRDSTFTRRSNESTSLWYADHLKSESTSSLICPKIELTEQLITHRPLRSEIDKRLSRPGSGQFRTNVTPSPTRSLSHALSSSSLTQSSSLSITQAKSSDENEVDDEEIEKPPPLPAKQSFVDYFNLLEDRNSNGDLDWTIPTKRNSGLMSPVKNKVNACEYYLIIYLIVNFWFLATSSSSFQTKSSTFSCRNIPANASRFT